MSDFLAFPGRFLVVSVGPGKSVENFAKHDSRPLGMFSACFLLVFWLFSACCFLVGPRKSVENFAKHDSFPLGLFSACFLLVFCLFSASFSACCFLVGPRKSVENFAKHDSFPSGGPYPGPGPGGGGHPKFGPFPAVWGPNFGCPTPLPPSRGPQGARKQAETTRNKRAPKKR